MSSLSPRLHAHIACSHSHGLPQWRSLLTARPQACVMSTYHPVLHTDSYPAALYHQSSSHTPDSWDAALYWDLPTARSSTQVRPAASAPYHSLTHSWCTRGEKVLKISLRVGQGRGRNLLWGAGQPFSSPEPWDAPAEIEQVPAQHSQAAGGPLGWVHTQYTAHSSQHPLAAPSWSPCPIPGC